MGRISSLAAAGLFATTATAAAAPRLAIPNILKRQEENVTSTTFANITASADLNWVECYQEMDPNLECTYLTVPLDYEKLDAGTTDIAFVRYFVSEEAEDLLVNPGGPAESGVEFAIGAGAEYSKKWNMNIVGFDPRAVSFSGPKIRCSYDSGNSTIPQSQNSNSSNSLQSSWDTNLAKNKACSDANKDTDAKYIGTLAVVQDMMHFVELQAALRGKDPKTAQINYYGVSYGTLIGQTLTAAYPDRLRRVLLDGNVYGVAHYQGWEPSGIDDFGPGIFMFSKLCFEAGAEWCKLAEGMSSIEEVQARFDAVIAKLNGSPMEAQGQTMDGNKFVQAIGGMMYQSKSEGGFRAMVNATLAAESGDTKYFESLSKRTVLTRASVGNVGDPTYVKTDVLTMITAVDIAGRYPWKTYEDWKAATMRLVATAQYNAIGYSTLNGLLGQAMDSFVPPPSQFFQGFEPINTSAPVLFVNTPGDQVTPRSSAYNMHRLFTDSSVFIHNSPGHGYANAPSKCSDAIIAAYFADATLPEYDTWCETDVEANYYFGGPDPAAE